MLFLYVCLSHPASFSFPFSLFLCPAPLSLSHSDQGLQLGISDYVLSIVQLYRTSIHVFTGKILNPELDIY